MYRATPRKGLAVGPHSYVPYRWLLNRTAEVGGASPAVARQLVRHREAPAPAATFAALMSMGQPDRHVALAILDAAAAQHTASDDGMARVARQILSSPRLARDPGVLDALCRALLLGGDYFEAAAVALRIPDQELTETTWRALLRAASTQKIRDPYLVGRLVDPARFPTAWPMSHQLAARLMLRAGPSGSGALPAPVAHALLRRYVLGTQAEAGAETKPGASPVEFFENAARNHHGRTAGDVSPVVFLAFFGSLRATRLPGGNFPLHWTLVWRAFQHLNRAAPQWHTEDPEQAVDMAKIVLESLARGADPWLGFTVAREVAAVGIMDGVEAALFFLHRLDAGHHAEAARAIARRIFRWLVHVVEIHRRPERRHDVVPACRVLIRLGMTKELAELHSAVICNVAATPEEFRAQFIETFADLVCPACHTILDDAAVANERVCANCMLRVPPKDSGAQPSFERTQAQLERGRQRAAEKKRLERKRMLAAVRQLPVKVSLAAPSPAPAPAVVKRDLRGARTRDAADTLREVLAPELASVAARTRGGPQRFELLERDLSPADLRSSLRLADAEAASSSIPAAQVELLLPAKAAPALRRKVPRFAPDEVVASPWACLWCQERNSPASSRVHCAACDAETGPDAAWRELERTVRPEDVLPELRRRVARAGQNDEEAIGAAHLLLVYRRAFMLQATVASGAFVDVSLLVTALVKRQERALAGFLYTRMVPPGLRAVDETLVGLASLFGADTAALAELSNAALADDAQLFPAVFGAACTQCFGAHRTAQCPILTRKFRTLSTTAPDTGAVVGKMHATDRERQALALAQILRAVSQAQAEAPGTVVAAYRAFVVSPYRESFGEAHPDAGNFLTQALCSLGEVKRACFVLCHVPLEHRSNDAYRRVAHHCAVTGDDVIPLVADRVLGDATAPHPNMIQVTRTCCVCFDGTHPSSACPHLDEWWAAAAAVTATPVEGSSEARALLALARRVQGWVHSGPERLQSFAKFLLRSVDALPDHIPPPLLQGVTACLEKLAATQRPLHKSLAFRLFARLPPHALARSTLAAVLRLNHVDEMFIQEMAAADTVGPDWFEIAVPPQVCLMCFSPDHRFYACPELRLVPHPKAVALVARQLGGLRHSPAGVAAAADQVHYWYQCGQLPLEMLRRNPDTAAALAFLARRCFALHMPRRGFRVLRRLPVQNVDSGLHPALWKAAGMAERDIPDALAAVHDALHGVTKALAPADSAPAPKPAPKKGLLGGGLGSVRPAAPRTEPAPPRPDLRVTLQRYRSAVEAGLCRHCLSAQHGEADCSVFMAESAYGRDLIAVFRVIVAYDKFTEEEAHRLLLDMAAYFLRFHRHLPYENVGVQRTTNALTVMLAMMEMPEAGLRLLLAIPAAYRMQHVFLHLLHAFGVPKAECTERMGSFLTTGDAPPDASVDSLVSFRAPIPDVAVRDLFRHAVGDVPKALAAGEAAIFREAAPAMRQAVQSADIDELSRAFDEIQCFVEDRVGLGLGSRHFLHQDLIEIEAPLDGPDPLLDDPEAGPAEGAAEANHAGDRPGPHTA